MYYLARRHVPHWALPSDLFTNGLLVRKKRRVHSSIRDLHCCLYLCPVRAIVA